MRAPFDERDTKPISLIGAVMCRGVRGWSDQTSWVDFICAPYSVQGWHWSALTLTLLKDPKWATLWQYMPCFSFRRVNFLDNAILNTVEPTWRNWQTVKDLFVFHNWNRENVNGGRGNLYNNNMDNIVVYTIVKFTYHENCGTSASSIWQCYNPI